MRIPAAVLAEVDYREAVVGELTARNRYLPPPLADRALLGHADDLAARLRAHMRREFHPAPQDSVLARKAGRGSRPLPYLALEDRFTYRALVNVIVGRLPVIAGRGDYDEFADSPLTVEGCNYVLKADVAAYYQYIDHERLIDEVVSQTGDDLAITSVAELLQGGSGRQFGLPQMNEASDVLADLYIDPIRRNLLRRGYEAGRYADDFRVACADYNEALEALEHIERSAFELGLVLNEAKTGTPGRETYEESRSEVRRAEQRLFDEQAVKGITIEEFFAAVSEVYSEDDEEVLVDVVMDAVTADERSLPGTEHDEADPTDEPAARLEPTGEQLAVAARVVGVWRDEETRNEYGWGSHIWSSLLRKSLATLEAGRDDRAVDSAITLLVNEPHLTPQVCNYLVAVGRDDPAPVHRVLDDVCGRDRNIVSIWQSLWVAYLAGSVSSGTRRRRRHVAWLEAQVDGAHDAVSAQAALALARRRQLTVELGARAYERAPESHRLTAALALAAARGVTGVEEVAADQVERWIGDWARKQTWGTRRRVLRRSRPAADRPL
jgi:hypothetical protein